MMPDKVSINPWIASEVTAMELEIVPIATLNMANNKLTAIVIKPALMTVSLCGLDLMLCPGICYDFNTILV